MEEFEEMLLHSARNGDIKRLKELLVAKQEKNLSFDVNCKGKSKSNLGWTPLHLASYFGHYDVVELLIQNEANIDIVNDGGDTPLHKAALTNRENVVQLLLQEGAKVSVINGEGCKASDLSREAQVSKLILAAERTEQRKHEESFFRAAREGNVEEIKLMLQGPFAAHINCTDTLGNTALHCAAYRGHIDVAVALLQNGCDSSLKNSSGQTAQELVQSPQMHQVLEVQPLKSFYKSVSRFEGPLLRRMRIVGWRMVWAVLDRGVITFFNSRADASSGVKRRDYKYLDGAKVMAMVGGDGSMLVIHYNDGTNHRLLATPDPLHSATINRQKWVSSISDHIRFASHYVLHGFSIDDDDENKDVKALGTLQDVLSTAGAHQQLLEQQVQEIMATIATVNAPQESLSDIHDIMKKFTTLSSTARNMTTSLDYCYSLMKQQEEVRELQLKEERDKVRVLEESLRVLATEHHDLEESIASHVSSGSSGNSLYNTPANSFMSIPRPRRFYDAMSDDTVFETCSLASIEDDDDRTIGDRPSPTGSDGSSNTLISCMSSLPLDPQTPTNETPSTDSSFKTSNGSAGVLGNTYTVNSDPSFEVLPHGHYRSVSGSFSLSGFDDVNLVTSSSANSAVLSSNTPKQPLLRTSDLSELDLEACDSDSTNSGLNSNVETKSSFSFISFGETKARVEPLRRTARPMRSWGRNLLPAPQFQRNDFSLWSVLKQCIGKELSKITMPVVFNEPLSFLERVTEFMEYGWLLDKADQAQDPITRMQYVAAFAVSGLACNWERIGKPFNPLLGETYELQRDNYRILCEQVSHHPPVSAFHSESPNWIFHGSMHPKLKFWGKSVEIQPKGTLSVELPNHGEAYTWSNVNCCVHNIIVGKLWIEQYGTMEITNHATGDRAMITFKTAGWFSKELHRIEGFILDKNKKKLSFLYGKWTEFLRATDIESYDDYMSSNVHKFRQDEIRKKSSDEAGSGSSSSSKKVFSRFNSITSSFRMSTDVEPPNLDVEPIEDPDEGNYPRTDSTYSIDIPNSVTLWEVDPRPEESPQYYHFTLYAMSLNEMETVNDRNNIILTDSRLRPDIRHLEEGDIDKAAEEKTRLEEKQRCARKSRKKGKDEWKSRWFTQGTNPFTKQEDWLYCGGYWDRNYSDVPDIF